ncbi:MAG TPA: shikimate dehydrogenase [Chthonomonadales bacterium]|nr:shikimate dehydrogenase [Chthonomonadales bacterium]
MSSDDRRYSTLSISGRTKILGVFGYPVEHSLSPAMHNAAIAALGIPFAYLPFSVRPEDIGPAIRSLAILGIIGVNLTIPHKERVLPFLDEVTPEAQAVGAVNTVHNDGGRLIGYNTDGVGFLAPLKASGITLNDRQVVVLGAGGAARSVVHSLAQEGAWIALANRTPERAVHLAEAVNAATGRSAARCFGLEDTAALADALAKAQLLVNTTSVGMSPHDEEMPPIPLDALHPGLLVYDLIYNPVKTKLLLAAERAGARTLNGVQMLVHQGAVAFRIWTGKEPPLEVMEQAVNTHLESANRSV